MKRRCNNEYMQVRRLLMVITMVVTFQLFGMPVLAQTESPDSTAVPADIPDLVPDTIPSDIEAELRELQLFQDTAAVAGMMGQQEKPAVVTPAPETKEKRDWSKWTPDPKRALWLALVIPGGGQIYNRKYWKLPIVYGGFLGCIYAMSWNNTMYKDYSQAFLDITDSDPETASYNKFLHLGRQITESNKDRYRDIFKKRKDKYRRWRDLSFFIMLGVYAFSVIDAYVDAELSQFDISKDLSLKVTPTVIGTGQSKNPVYANAVGVNCSISF